MHRPPVVVALVELPTGAPDADCGSGVSDGRRPAVLVEPDHDLVAGVIVRPRVRLGVREEVIGDVDGLPWLNSIGPPAGDGLVGRELNRQPSVADLPAPLPTQHRTGVGLDAGPAGPAPVRAPADGVAGRTGVPDALGAGAAARSPLVVVDPVLAEGDRVARGAGLVLLGHVGRARARLACPARTLAGTCLAAATAVLRIDLEVDACPAAVGVTSGAGAFSARAGALGKIVPVLPGKSLRKQE